MFILWTIRRFLKCRKFSHNLTSQAISTVLGLIGLRMFDVWPRVFSLLLPHFFVLPSVIFVNATINSLTHRETDLWLLIDVCVVNNALTTLDFYVRVTSMLWVLLTWRWRLSAAVHAFDTGPESQRSTRHAGLRHVLPGCNLLELHWKKTTSKRHRVKYWV